MKFFTVTITGLAPDEIDDDWIHEAAAHAELQLQEPEHFRTDSDDSRDEWQTGSVRATTTIEHRDASCGLCNCAATTFKFGIRVCPYHVDHGEDDPTCPTCNHPSGPEPAIWTATRGGKDGWYIEGIAETYGWFCIEVETDAEVDEELRHLGFTDDQIAKAKSS